MFEEVSEEAGGEKAPLSNVKFALTNKNCLKQKVTVKSERDVVFVGTDQVEEYLKEEVTHIEEKQVKGPKTKPNANGPLVIPMIVRNDWRVEKYRKIETRKSDGEKLMAAEISTVQHTLTGQVNDNGDKSLMDAAKEALLKEAQGITLAAEGEDEKMVLSVPLLLHNKVPEGYETDTKLDVSLRPNEDEADYQSVPIDQFGLAMLRGMGWTEGAPIGRTNKQLVEAIIPELRPKGLGLGADRSKANGLKKHPGDSSSTNLQETSKNEAKNPESAKELKIGAYVKIFSGIHRDSYGKVESFDEDNSRVLIRLAIGNGVVGVHQYSVDVVDEKEFNRESKCINKSKYDRYKTAQMKQFAGHLVVENPLQVHDGHLVSDGERSSDGGDLEMFELEKKRKRKCKLDDGSPNGRKKSKKKMKDKKKSKKDPSIIDGNGPWIRPDLVVRFVNDQYKKGKYFNEKMLTIDVADGHNCSLQDAQGRIIDGIAESWLETVIPRDAVNVPVMVVRGIYRGRTGHILDRDKKVQVCRVRMTDDETVIAFNFDDICQFAGNILVD